MNGIRKLTTLTAALLVVMALVPAAAAQSASPLRASGTMYYDGGGWASEVSGDVTCTGYETSESRIVGPEPLAIGTMHWLGTWVAACDGGTITIEATGHWSFANSKWVQNGTVTDATGAYAHLVGSSAHVFGTVDMSQFPTALTGTVNLRIN